MSKKLSPWFSGDQRPWEPGVYHRRHPLNNLRTVYSKWNGNYWCMYAEDVATANDCDYQSRHQDLPWRGLAEKPG